MSDTTREEPHRWLSVSETAMQLGTSSHTVRRWIKTGVLHATQPAGQKGLIRIPESEIERLERSE
jgi:excisionase family DNA binding protein